MDKMMEHMGKVRAALDEETLFQFRKLIREIPVQGLWILRAMLIKKNDDPYLWKKYQDRIDAINAELEDR